MITLIERMSPCLTVLTLHSTLSAVYSHSMIHDSLAPFWLFSLSDSVMPLVAQYCKLLDLDPVRLQKKLSLKMNSTELKSSTLQTNK